jgi:hypothetical protein
LLLFLLLLQRLSMLLRQLLSLLLVLLFELLFSSLIRLAGRHPETLESRCHENIDIQKTYIA